MFKRSSTIAATIVFQFLFANISTAQVVVRPPDLNVGDQYRLVFVTSDATDAGGESVGPFNDLIEFFANAVPELANLNTQWRAVISSQTFGAIENIYVGDAGELVPIYRLDGMRVADDTFDLFDGSLQQPINRTEANAVSEVEVWTGSNFDGTPSDEAIGSSIVTFGFSSQSNIHWIEAGIDANGLSRSFYGISSVLTVSLVLGDINGDGVVDLLDVDPFIELVATGTFQTEADINEDGVVNLLDVGPFVELLNAP